MAAVATAKEGSEKPHSRELDSESPPLQPIRISTPDGELEGAVQDGIAYFRGIPFAEAPIGPLRWKPPIRNKPWEGVRAATEFGNSCPQKRMGPPPGKKPHGGPPGDMPHGGPPGDMPHGGPPGDMPPGGPPGGMPPGGPPGDMPHGGPPGDMPHGAPPGGMPPGGPPGGMPPGGPSFMRLPRGPSPPQSEDCLYLNVYAPEGAKNLPVMIWIHGGGFQMGSGADFLWDGLRWLPLLPAADKVVLVTINYRLNVFGFLGSYSLESEHALNLGLLDQQEAMRWVKRSISSFGGNPADVTVFGESAGAVSIGCHLLADNGTQELFEKAILQSGSYPGLFASDLRSVAKAQELFEAIAANLGCSGESDILGCMRKKDASEVLDAIPPGLGKYGNIPLSPILAPPFFSQLPQKAVSAGLISLVPKIVGTNTDEGGFFLKMDRASISDQAQLNDFISGFFPMFSVEDVSAAYDLYDPMKYFTSYGNPFLKAASELLGDVKFICNADHLAAASAAKQAKTFRYRFDFKFNGEEAKHGEELPVLFPPPGSGLTTANDIFLRAWSHFAHAGVPFTVDAAVPPSASRGEPPTLTAGAPYLPPPGMPHLPPPGMPHLPPPGMPHLPPAGMPHLPPPGMPHLPPPGMPHLPPPGMPHLPPPGMPHRPPPGMPHLPPPGMSYLPPPGMPPMPPHGVPPMPPHSVPPMDHAGPPHVPHAGMPPVAREATPPEDTTDWPSYAKGVQLVMVSEAENVLEVAPEIHQKRGEFWRVMEEKYLSFFV